MSKRTKPGWLERLLEIVSRIVLPACVSLYFSSILQSLTVSALWLPKDWRMGIEFLVTFGSALTVVIVSVFWKKIFSAKLSKQLSPLFAFLLLAAGTGCFFEIRSMREECVWHVNKPADWWQKQFGEGTQSNNMAQIEQVKLPDFINIERSSIFLPPKFDPAMNDYLTTVGEGNLQNGIQVTLDREPIRLVDWAKGYGMEIRKDYTLRFLYWHFGAILLLSAAWGLFTEKTELAVEGFIEKFVLK